MSERALSEDAMLASLRDIHLPVEAAGGVLAEIAATVGLACGFALLVAIVFRAVSLKKPTGQRATLQARRADMAGLSEEDRRLAMLHLLRKHAPEKYASLRKSLYRPAGGVDIAVLEAEVNRLV